MTNERNRCPWADGDEKMAKYHDEVWGKPEHDDQGRQAVLHWEIRQVDATLREKIQPVLDETWGSPFLAVNGKLPF